MDGKTILAFLLGTVTGAAGTYVCLREATERYISNEIQAFKEESGLKLIKPRKTAYTRPQRHLRRVLKTNLKLI